MAQAYSNLEQKLGGTTEDGEDSEETVEEFNSEDYGVEDENDASEIASVVDDAGIDFQVLQEEYNELGGLSEDAYAALEEAGFPQGVVEAWIQGQEALNQNYEATVFESVGGKEAYAEMIGWASENLTPQEIAAYDRAVDSGDVAMVQLAIAGLKSKYETVEGSDPSLIGGQSTNSTGGTYGSWQEVTADMKDPRYGSDPAYRQKVTAKLNRSDVT